SLLLLAEFVNRRVQCGDACSQGRDVANSTRLPQSLSQACDGSGDVLRWSSALRTLLQQRHLSLEIGELALEVSERLIRGTVRKLPDFSPVVSLADEHSSRL